MTMKCSVVSWMDPGIEKGYYVENYGNLNKISTSIKNNYEYCFIKCSIYTILILGVHNRGTWVGECGSCRRTLKVPAQFFCMYKTVLKNKVNF